jgi:hypothetical protein
MNTAQATVYKFAEIIYRPECQGIILICSLFGLSKVLHLCPPGEVSNTLIAFMVSIIANRRSNDEEYIAALRCIYLTAKLTNVHKTTLI